MEQLTPIKLRRGATTVVEIDMTGFDPKGGEFVLTLSDKKGKPQKEWRTNKAEVWSVLFPDEFTAGLKVGEGNYLYDIMHHVDGERFAKCEPSEVTVVMTAGGYQNEADA